MGFPHSQFHYKEALDRYVRPGVRWLDIGCGNSLIPTWIADSIPFQKELLARCSFACGCDPVDDRPHVVELPKFVGPCDRLPYPDGSFDLVTANMVVEHLTDPAAFSSEVARVLSDGGRLLLHTPNRWYPPITAASMLPNSLVRKVARWADGRQDEEIFPAYYRLNTKAAIEALPAFSPVWIRGFETAPVLKNFPLVSKIEELLIRVARRQSFEWLRADWIALLEKTAASTDWAQSNNPASADLVSDQKAA